LILLIVLHDSSSLVISDVVQSVLVSFFCVIVEHYSAAALAVCAGSIGCTGQEQEQTC